MYGQELTQGFDRAGWPIRSFGTQCVCDVLYNRRQYHTYVGTLYCGVQGTLSLTLHIAELVHAPLQPSRQQTTGSHLLQAKQKGLYAPYFDNPRVEQ